MSVMIATDKPFWSNGPSAGSFYDFPGNAAANHNSYVSSANPGGYGHQRSTQPTTTGTSVVGLVFQNGVMISADTLLSYGSLAKYTDVDRVFKLNDETIIGVGGDYADFQYIKSLIDDKVTQDAALNDQHRLSARDLYNWLTRVLYNRRSRMNPLWLEIVVGGMVLNEALGRREPFLGHINRLGRAYEATVVATGFAAHLGLPLLREISANGYQELTELKATAHMKEIMEVLFYRDCRSFPKYKLATVISQDFVNYLTVQSDIYGNENIKQKWNVAHFIKGY